MPAEKSALRRVLFKSVTNDQVKAQTALPKSMTTELHLYTFRSIQEAEILVKEKCSSFFIKMYTS